MMRRTISTVTLVMGLALPGLVDAGCMAIGYGGTVIDSRCEYVATDTEDFVFGTGPVPLENYWFVSVTRNCPTFVGAGCTPVLDEVGCEVAAENTCAPTGSGNRQVILADGNGIPTEQPFVVRPKVGETVTVEMVTLTNGPYGFLSVGQYDDILSAVPSVSAE